MNPPVRHIRNLEQASCLVASGFKFLGTIKRPDHKLFIFADDARIDTILAGLLSGDLQLPARDLFKIWKNLRGMTFEVAPGVPPNGHGEK